jgi:hypothetical protein
MFRSFNACLDRTLNQSGIPVDVQRALDPERVKLAAMNIPAGVSESVRVTLERAIDECFVFGFRRVSLIGAGLALASSIVALVTLRGRDKS